MKKAFDDTTVPPLEIELPPIKIGSRYKFRVCSDAAADIQQTGMVTELVVTYEGDGRTKLILTFEDGRPG